jgi:hypothetical protein
MQYISGVVYCFRTSGRQMLRDYPPQLRKKLFFVICLFSKKSRGRYKYRKKHIICIYNFTLDKTISKPPYYIFIKLIVLFVFLFSYSPKYYVLNRGKLRMHEVHRCKYGMLYQHSIDMEWAYGCYQIFTRKYITQVYSCSPLNDRLLLP